MYVPTSGRRNPRLAFSRQTSSTHTSCATMGKTVNKVTKHLSSQTRSPQLRQVSDGAGSGLSKPLRGRWSRRPRGSGAISLTKTTDVLT